MANEVTTVQQGAGLMSANQMSGAMASANSTTKVAMTREMSETLAAVQMAKMFPRDVVAARDRILNACTRPKLAETACYTYNRGGTDVTGPSIRLAEMLCQEWGNVEAGIRELEQRNGVSTCEAFAWDKETNFRTVKVFQVPHVRYTKSRGAVPLTDPRDIYEMVANQGSRRLRACILSMIPGDIVEEAVTQCDATLSSKVDLTPDRIKGMIEKFKEINVTREQIEDKIQCHIDVMKPAQFVQLGKIYNSIRDGMSKADDWFSKRVDNGGASSVDAAMAKEAASLAATDVAAAFGLKKGTDVKAPAEPKANDAPAKAATAKKSESAAANNGLPADLF